MDFYYRGLSIIWRQFLMGLKNHRPKCCLLGLNFTDKP